MFGGETYSQALDRERLTRCLERVRYCMTNPVGRWWTLAELTRICGGSEAGVSARIRDLRKVKFGGFIVEHDRIEGGLWRYRIVGLRSESQVQESFQWHG